MPTKRPVPSGKLVLVIGPSGVGKSVLLKELRSRHPDLTFPRSATTRERRQGEGDELYRFLTEEEFDRYERAGAFLEWARVHGGARYGTLLEEILPAIERGAIVVREVDVQGFRSIREHELFAGSGAKYRLQSVFILPENRQQLIERIRRRSPISDEELAARIASMDREIGEAGQCSAQVVNREGKIQETLAKLEEVIFSAT